MMYVDKCFHQSLSLHQDSFCTCNMKFLGNHPSQYLLCKTVGSQSRTRDLCLLEDIYLSQQMPLALERRGRISILSSLLPRSLDLADGKWINLELPSFTK